MTTEEILKEIEELTKLNREYRSRVNQVLNEVSGVIKHADKALKEEYERGIKDAWNLARDICNAPSRGGLTSDQIKIVFCKTCVMDVMDNYSYEEAKNRMDEYLAKKITEEEPIVRGDIVVCTREYINGTISYTGIFLKEYDGHYCILVSENEKDVDRHVLKSELWNITKLDGHVDLD